MATLVFGALGTLVGGPLGGAIGSLIGREVDQRLIGGAAREGPRLKELAISVSSYGQPIARLFGVTRSGGTIIWSTDLQESRDTVSGGKGRPGTTQYSYSVSLAVALSSRPIESVGRIWADGNLLRGAAGDLKTGGMLRVYKGHGDQLPDPLLAAALGTECPAHRGLAYVVFEDLALGDFGNRIPALSFEVFADGAGADLPGALARLGQGAIAAEPVTAAAPLQGFAHEQGSLADALETIATVAPMRFGASQGVVTIAPPSSASAPLTPPPIAWADGDFGLRTGKSARRAQPSAPAALRYYDRDRDYQPGLQRGTGRAGQGAERILELPATLTGSEASALVEGVRLRAAQRADGRRLRIASLDTRYLPGRLVELDAADWRVIGWEWRDGGVELELVREAAAVTSASPADSGQPWRPADRLGTATLLHAFELPWDGIGASDGPRIHVAASAAEGRWGGAVLYAEQGDALVRIDAVGPQRAVTGRLLTPLGSSPALMFEMAASCEVELDWSEGEFLSRDEIAVATGANRLLVGGEILQFLEAARIAPARWRLSGLLRGRGATEADARAGHPSGASVIFLDDRVTVLESPALEPPPARLAAIGSSDADPVFAEIRDSGRARRPLSPVHPVAVETADRGIALGWTRRARGSWWWRVGIDAPLVEAAETYEIGAGPVAQPVATWLSDTPALVLTPAMRSSLPPGTALWVRQIGSFGRSPELRLHII